MLAHMRAELRAGRLSAAAAEAVLVRVGWLWGGTANPGLVDLLSGRPGNYDLGKLSEARAGSSGDTSQAEADRLEQEAALRKAAVEDMIGPPTEAEWNVFRRLREGGDREPWWFPSGPWHPADLAAFEGALRRVVEGPDDLFSLAGAMGLASVAIVKPGTEAIPVLRELAASKHRVSSIARAALDQIERAPLRGRPSQPPLSTTPNDRDSW
jgi:hypothetical protein